MSATYHIDRVKKLIKYILAAAGQEDFGSREVGQIHIIKYIYLADLSYAERHHGQTYTNISWRFHHYGPWSNEVWSHIEPVISEIGAVERKYSSPKYENDFKRWSLVDDQLFERLDHSLPLIIVTAIRKAIHQFGDDTSGLLHYVYKTPPMLHAAPGENLYFSIVKKLTENKVIENKLDKEKEPTVISKSAQKRKKAAIEALKKRMKEKLASKRDPSKRKPASPAPRYDDLFYNGMVWLDSLAGNEIGEQEGQLEFSSDIWKSPTRSETDVS